MIKYNELELNNSFLVNKKNNKKESWNNIKNKYKKLNISNFVNISYIKSNIIKIKNKSLFKKKVDISNKRKIYNKEYNKTIMKLKKNLYNKLNNKVNVNINDIKDKNIDDLDFLKLTINKIYDKKLYNIDKQRLFKIKHNKEIFKQNYSEFIKINQKQVKINKSLINLNDFMTDYFDNNNNKENKAKILKNSISENFNKTKISDINLNKTKNIFDLKSNIKNTDNKFNNFYRKIFKSRKKESKEIELLKKYNKNKKIINYNNFIGECDYELYKSQNMVNYINYNLKKLKRKKYN